MIYVLYSRFPFVGVYIDFLKTFSSTPDAHSTKTEDNSMYTNDWRNEHKSITALLCYTAADLCRFYGSLL